MLLAIVYWYVLLSRKANFAANAYLAPDYKNCNFLPMGSKFDNLASAGSGRPLIIATNDDGAYAKGFAALIEAAGEFGDVLAIAPDTGMSGMSHALTFKKPVRLTHISSQPGLEMYKLSGTPVDCVKMAIDKLVSKRPALLVSGINHGSNASISSIYSGTVAAAREGGLNGIPSVAFSSLDYSEDADFEPLKKYIKLVCAKVLTDGIASGTCLNVNFPCHDMPNIKGLKVCRQANGVWVEEFVLRQDPVGQDYYWLTGHFCNHEPGACDTDEYFLAENYASLVPISIHVTDMESVVKLQSWQTGAL
jgi:5'-nucleotidase